MSDRDTLAELIWEADCYGTQDQCDEAAKRLLAVGVCLPDEQARLRARIAELEATQADDAAYESYLHYTYNIEFASERDDFEEWKKEYWTHGCGEAVDRG
ncbi:hypothetical protein [Nocardia salmonicida]|uniref:hypothetical protein n=1 Tax=Nocardia salmonicida TaxID=53431 RepID=UPI00363D92FB